MVKLTNGMAFSRFAQRLGAKAFSLAIAHGFYRWGRRSTAARPMRVSGEQWISVGSGVYFGSGCWLNAVPECPVSKPVIEIGDGCSFSGACVISAASSVKLGREVLLARNVYIADHDHAYTDTTKAIRYQGITNVARVVIDDGAWLGQNVVITAGTHIGRGAVVGANAVVTRDVPDYSLAVGVPARVIKAWVPEMSRTS